MSYEIWGDVRFFTLKASIAAFAALLGSEWYPLPTLDYALLFSAARFERDASF
jgi:hypothetical protein